MKLLQDKKTRVNESTTIAMTYGAVIGATFVFAVNFNSLWVYLPVAVLAVFLVVAGLKQAYKRLEVK